MSERGYGLSHDLFLFVGFIGSPCKYNLLKQERDCGFSRSLLLFILTGRNLLRRYKQPECLVRFQTFARKTKSRTTGTADDKRLIRPAKKTRKSISMCKKRRRVSMWQKTRRAWMWSKYAIFTKQLSSAQKTLHDSFICAVSFLDSVNFFCSQQQ
jgi:hypothetical protein